MCIQGCSQKGYLCEICKSTDVIYPFDLEDTTRVSELESNKAMIEVWMRCISDLPTGLTCRRLLYCYICLL